MSTSLRRRIAWLVIAVSVAILAAAGAVAGTSGRFSQGLALAAVYALVAITCSGAYLYGQKRRRP